MRVDLFDFHLPESCIALRPAVPRDASRLLLVRPTESPILSDYRFFELPSLLRAGDLLVFNDTRVLPAQLMGRRVSRDCDSGRSAKVRVTLHRRVDKSRWRAFVRPWRRVRVGDHLIFHLSVTEPDTQLVADVVEKVDRGELILSFNHAGDALDEAVNMWAETPLPPYIVKKRSVDEADRGDYQTIYARWPGSVAAPTAGLHFTQALCDRLADRGVLSAFVTLHIGAGTFLPVVTEDTDTHIMHAERGNVDARCVEQIERTRRAGGRIVAVGTTVLRLLESAVNEDGNLRPFSGETKIFMVPGYDFRVADALITNFHTPRSTLFMLVCAFSGLENMRKAYAHAISSNYRFYSYGDACFLCRVLRGR